MIMKRPVLNLSSNKPVPPRVFDVVVYEDRVDIEVKNKKNEIEKIPWDDVVYQVKAAIAAQIK